MVASEGSDDDVKIIKVEISASVANVELELAQTRVLEVVTTRGLLTTAVEHQPINPKP